NGRSMNSEIMMIFKEMMKKEVSKNVGR
ncbi:MAG: Arc family DNA-binding protein, partial [Aeromonas sp.]